MGSFATTRSTLSGMVMVLLNTKMDSSLVENGTVMKDMDKVL